MKGGFRFRRRGFSRRGTREQLIWNRQELTVVDAGGVFGTPLVQTIFLPDGLLGGGSLDERFTVRRVLISYFHKVVYTAGANVAQVRGFGVYMAGNSEPTRDPLMTAAADRETDWLGLEYSGFLFGGAAGTEFHSPSPQSGQNWSLDIRAMRKVNQDQQLNAVVNLKRADSAADAAPTVTRQTLTVDVAVLFQRTRR